MGVAGGLFGSSLKNIKNLPPENFLHFRDMEFSSSNVRNLIIFQETETLKILLIFSQKKTFLILREKGIPKKLLML